MRILHTSDWHLGRQLHNVSLLDEQARVLDQIATIIVDQEVDVVVVAGDIFDRSVPPADAITLLDGFINRVQGELKVPLIMISGNHDGPQRLAFGARQMAQSGVRIIGPLPPLPSPLVLSDAHGEVAFYGLPYADPPVVSEALGVTVTSHEQAMHVLCRQVEADNPKGRRCVVIAHCFVGGGAESESERPLLVGGVAQVPAALFRAFDYVALGHLHRAQSFAEQRIRYSGSPLKYAFGEAGDEKSVTLVELGERGELNCEQIVLRPHHDLRVVEGYLDELLDAGRGDPCREDYLMVRLLDDGAILDAMGRLRELFPNVMHLERPAFLAAGEGRVADRSLLRRGEMTIFENFFEQMTGDPMSADQRCEVASVIDEINTGEQ